MRLKTCSWRVGVWSSGKEGRNRGLTVCVLRRERGGRRVRKFEVFFRTVPEKEEGMEWTRPARQMIERRVKTCSG